MVDAGWVALIGAGPGDPGLLTLAGREALENAQVVLYDQLVGGAALSLIPAAAERIEVGKNVGRRPVPQAEINSLLVQYARAGKRVVRLKGGDPFLFGRGGEEAEALRRAGVRFRVIPGVSSALAAAAAAGIPITHREFASSVHIVSGRAKNGLPPKIPYAELARLEGTLIFLMGLAALPAVRDGLLTAGLAPDTPSALIENGTLPGQRRLLSPLAEMPERAAAAGFAPPSLLVVGRVCSLASDLEWRERRILAVGAGGVGRLAASLRRAGFHADELAMLRQRALPQPEGLWRRLPSFQWIIMTSRFGAGLFFDQLLARGIDIRRLAGTKFAVVGPGTAEILRGRGVLPDYVPEKYGAGPLAEGLAEILRPGQRVLLYRACGANSDLEVRLGQGGFGFEAVEAYETLEQDVGAIGAGDKAGQGFYDAVAFTSPSAVKGFARRIGRMNCRDVRCFCLGETTAGVARGLGIGVEAVGDASIDGLAAVLLARLGGSVAGHETATINQANI
ncbi:MAG: uroporphyrinogen-III C-methyltransferase [Planctomycetota bacterium]|nr:uroporphyrinogen-III C-methyltransferase [Planctomycetota bacterium]